MFIQDGDDEMILFRLRFNKGKTNATNSYKIVFLQTLPFDDCNRDTPCHDEHYESCHLAHYHSKLGRLSIWILHDAEATAITHRCVHNYVLAFGVWRVGKRVLFEDYHVGRIGMYVTYE